MGIGPSLENSPRWGKKSQERGKERKFNQSGTTAKTYVKLIQTFTGRLFSNPDKIYLFSSRPHQFCLIAKSIINTSRWFVQSPSKMFSFQEDNRPDSTPVQWIKCGQSFSWWSSCGPECVSQETQHAIHAAAITNVFKKTPDLVPLHENVVSFFTWRSLRGPDRVPLGNNLATPI